MLIFHPQLKLASAVVLCYVCVFINSGVSDGKILVIISIENNVFILYRP